MSGSVTSNSKFKLVVKMVGSELWCIPVASPIQFSIVVHFHGWMFWLINACGVFPSLQVMNKGQVKEFDSPYTLLQTQTSLFRKMVDRTGPSASRKLYQMALEAHLRRRGRVDTIQGCERYYDWNKDSKLNPIPDPDTVIVESPLWQNCYQCHHFHIIYYKYNEVSNNLDS